MKTDNNIATQALIAVAMSGDINGAFDSHSNILAQECRNNSSFPHKCNLTNEQLESLGFIIGESQDKYLRTVNLPKGWEIRHKNAMHFSLYDNKGRYRGHVMMDNRAWDRGAYARFIARYSVCRNHDDDNCNLNGVIIQDNGGISEYNEKPNIIRKSEMFNTSINLEKNIRVKHENILREKEAEYKEILKRDFPEHESILAYWD